MIFDLVEKKNIGSPEQRKQASAVLDELWKKQAQAMKSGDLPRVIYDENKPEFKNEPSLIKKALDAKNQQIRKRLLREKDE